MSLIKDKLVLFKRVMESHDDSETLGLVLGRLKSLTPLLDAYLLQETFIGIEVFGLRNHFDPHVAEEAKKLISR